jgi:molybdopterin-dependent oxidoreductase alpha subunit
MGVWERMDDAFLDRLDTEFGFTSPRAHGYDVVASIEAMEAGRVGVFVSLGGNFLSATPDTEVVARGLRATKLSVCISTKLNRGHLVTGASALILPCLTRVERDDQATGPQFVTVENTVSVVSRSHGTLAPASPMLKSEPAIVAGIAAATLRGRYELDWAALVADYDRIRDRISRVVKGFDDFNARIRRDDEIFYAPVAAKDRIFNTPTGKARFAVNALPEHAIAPGQFVMMTIRTHDQFNTVVYGPDDRYRGIFGGRRVIFMNADDMRAAGFADGQLVDITSHFAQERRTITRFRVVPYDIPRGSTATYYPETNPIIPLHSTAAISNTPTSKFIVVSLRPSAAA